MFTLCVLFFIIVIDFFSCDLSKILVHICKIIRYA
jgi:hypothetical protein